MLERVDERLSYQQKLVAGSLLTQLQDGVRYMVMEGAQHTLAQALLLCNVQALHEDRQGFLIQPLA